MTETICLMIGFTIIYICIIQYQFSLLPKKTKAYLKNARNEDENYKYFKVL